MPCKTSRKTPKPLKISHPPPAESLLIPVNSYFPQMLIAISLTINT